MGFFSGKPAAAARIRRRCTSRWSPVLRVEVRKILTRYMLWGYPYCKSSAQRRTRALPKGDVHGSSEEGSSEEGGEEARQEEGSGQEGDGEEGRQGPEEVGRPRTSPGAFVPRVRSKRASVHCQATFWIFRG